MTTNIAPAPAFYLTEKTITSFDARMAKLGFIYEGAIDALWIYRKSKTQSISVQVGLGGVLYVSVIESDYTGRVVKRTQLDLSKINTPVKLTNFIGKLF
jgi:hypothetical protein